MRILVLAFGLFTSTAALAAPKAPSGTGNFRRAEALALVGAIPSETRVIGLATAAKHDAGLSTPTASRVLLLQKGFDVIAVNAPLDRSEKVAKMTTPQMNQLGLKSQPQAKAIALRATGEYRGPGKLSLQNYGMAIGAHSYQFRQQAPLGFPSTSGGQPVTVTDVLRQVSYSGRGSTANASVTPIE